MNIIVLIYWKVIEAYVIGRYSKGRDIIQSNFVCQWLNTESTIGDDEWIIRWPIVFGTEEYDKHY